MRELLEPLAARFSEAHPGIVFELDLRGTKFAPAALANGTSAFAPMGAVFTPRQLADYRRRQPRDPACFRVAHASPDPAALSGPLGVYVNVANPVPALSLTDLRRVFSGSIDTWGQLGLGDPWRARRIVAYGLGAGTALQHEFSARVLGDAEARPAAIALGQSADVVARVAADPAGVGFAAANRARPGVRLVPLRVDVHDAPVLPTATSLQAGRYPLDRFLYLCATQPLTAIAREFIRYAVSDEGQQAVAATPQRYVPLGASERSIERSRLDD